MCELLLDLGISAIASTCYYHVWCLLVVPWLCDFTYKHTHRHTDTHTHKQTHVYIYDSQQMPGLSVSVPPHFMNGHMNSRVTSLREPLPITIDLGISTIASTCYYHEYVCPIMSELTTIIPSSEIRGISPCSTSVQTMGSSFIIGHTYSSMLDQAEFHTPLSLPLHLRTNNGYLRSSK